MNIKQNLLNMQKNIEVMNSNFYKIELSKSLIDFVWIKDDLKACAKMSTSSSVSLDN